MSVVIPNPGLNKVMYMYVRNNHFVAKCANFCCNL